MTSIYSTWFILFCAISLACTLPCLSQNSEEATDLETTVEDTQEAIQEEESQNCMVLNLDQAISRALNFNRQIIGQLDSTIKAEYGIILAQSEFDIKWVPNSKVGYSGGDRDGTGASFGYGLTFSKLFETGTELYLTPMVGKTGQRYYSQIEARISQPLFKGLGREYQLSRLKTAQFGLRSACRNIYLAQLQLVMRTINAMYDVIKAQKAMELNKISFERITKFYQVAKLKEKIGFADALDVYRAEVEWQQAQDALTSSQERLQDSYDTLKDLLALPLEICIQVDVPLVPTPNTMTLEEATQTAIDQRVEIELAEDQWRENYRLAYIAKDDLYPDLNLVVDFSNDGRDELFMRTWSNHRQSRWGIGLESRGEVNPIGDDITYKQKLLAVQASERSLDQKKAEIILEVKRALRNLQKAAIRIEAQHEQIHTAQGQLQLATIKFERGIANNFDVIQAEKTLRSAQHTYWSALIDHIIGEYQFLIALGILTDKPQIL